VNVGSRLPKETPFVEPYREPLANQVSVPFAELRQVQRAARKPRDGPRTHLAELDAGDFAKRIESRCRKQLCQRIPQISSFF
jgi:hypothetical protein